MTTAARLGVAAAALGAALALPSQRAEATAVSVSSEAEYRAALAALSVDAAGPHMITLAADLTITGATDPTYDGSEALILDGAGHVVDGGGTRRALVVTLQTDLTVQHLTVEHGHGSGDGGAINAGGAVTVVDSRFEGNVATSDGGAVAADGTAGPVTVESSTFVGNRAHRDGGAVTSFEVSVASSTFLANGARNEGGAIRALDVPMIEASTFAANEAATKGGAVAVEGILTAVNSTFTRNEAGVEGGGFDVIGGLGRVHLIHVTMAGNAAPIGAQLQIGREMSVQRSVFSNPRGGGSNCAVAIGGGDHSYSTDASCHVDTVGPDPELAPLGPHGGPTPVQLPSLGSPLIDAVACDPAVTVDQRGVARPQEGEPGGPATCDIGAVEVRPGEAPPPPPRPPPPRPPPPPEPFAGAPPFTG